MTRTNRPALMFVGGLLLGLSGWLLAATQLPNAAEQRNAMITELRRLNQQIAGHDKQLGEIHKELVAIKNNTK